MLITPAQKRRVLKFKKRHIALLKKMAVYKKRLHSAKTERKKASAQRKIHRLEGRITGLLRKTKNYIAKASKVKVKSLRPKKRKRAAAPRKKAVSSKTHVKKERTKAAESIKKEKASSGVDQYGKDHSMKASNIPPEMYERISRAAHRTFDAIGGDLMQVVQESGGHDMKQGEVIESVFDADRMDMYGGDKEAYEYCKKLPWDEIEKLGKKIFPYKRYS